MSYIKTLKNGEIVAKNTKKRQMTPYDRFMAKRRPATTPTTKKLNISSPKNLVDLQKIIDQIKNKKGVLISLSNLSEVEHQRMLDYLAGATYSLSATIKKIEQTKYLIIPKGMEIVVDFDY